MSTPANYNPEQSLNEFIPAAKQAVEQFDTADAEYRAIKDEMDRVYGERLETARVKRDEAAAQMETVKSQLKEAAYDHWLLAPDTRKFWTVDKLITVQEKRQIQPEYDRAAVRAWVFQYMPALMEVKWDALEHLVKTMDEIAPSRRTALAIPMPPQIQLETVNLVAVNLERVAALGAINTDALIEKATAGVTTPLMVQETD